MLQYNGLLKALLNGLTLCKFMHYLSNMDTKLSLSFSSKLLNTCVYDCTHILQFIFVLNGGPFSNQILLACLVSINLIYYAILNDTNVDGLRTCKCW